ncbi:MAG: hypothetical protein WBB27_08895 [Maribacter sp.]
MKKLILSAIILLGIAISCTDRDDDVATINIRIKNNTDFFFNEVRLTQRDTTYENVGVGEFSEYFEYEQAFQTAALTIVADSTTFNYVPAEIPTDSLPIGFYTYELGLDEEEMVTFTFRIDY